MQLQVFRLVCGVNVMSQPTGLEGHFEFLLDLGPLGFVLEDRKMLDIRSGVLAENLQLVVLLAVKLHERDNSLSRLVASNSIQFHLRALNVTRQVDQCCVVLVQLLELSFVPVGIASKEASSLEDRNFALPGFNNNTLLVHDIHMVAWSFDVFECQSHEVVECVDSVFMQCLKDRILREYLGVSEIDVPEHLLQIVSHIRTLLTLCASWIWVTICPTVLRCEQRHRWIRSLSNLVSLIADAIWQLS